MDLKYQILFGYDCNPFSNHLTARVKKLETTTTSQMTYDEYVNAETIMSMRQIYGEKSVMFRQTPNAMRIYSNFQNVAAEAEMECF